MKKFFALFLALIMVFGLVSVPKAVVADEEVKPATEYTITVNQPAEGGSIWTDPEVTTIAAGSELKLWSSEPEKDYVFDHWVIEGDYELVENTLNNFTVKIKVKSDLVITAVYKKLVWKVTVQAKTQYGTVTVKPGEVLQSAVGEDAQVVIIATATAEGYVFDKWSDFTGEYKIIEETLSDDGRVATRTIEVMSDCVVNASFKQEGVIIQPKEYTIKVNDPTPAEGGKIWADQETVPASNPYAKLWSEAKKGYAFSHWVIEGDYELVVYTLNDPTCEIEVKSDLVVTAVFVASDYYFYLDPNNVTLNVGEQATIISYMSYNGGEGQPFDATGGSWKVEPREGLKLVKGEGTGEYTVIAEAAGKYEITAITSTPDGGKHHAKATVVVEEPADYDSFVRTRDGYF